MAQPLIEQDQIAFNAGFGLLPTGAILPFGGSTAPVGFLLCDGSVVTKTIYATLYNVIGDTYNTGGELSTEFRLPNLNGKAPVGVNGATFASLGTTTGTETHTLTTAQMPSHNHSGSTGGGGSHSHSGVTDTTGDHSHNTNVANTAGTGATATGQNVNSGPKIFTDTTGNHSHSVSTDAAPNHTHSISSAGSGNAHNNIQPSIALNFIIAL